MQRERGVRQIPVGTWNEIAWHNKNSGDEAEVHPVAGKMPNAWGLYDMIGNAFEWTADWMAPYQNAAQTDPVGPPTGKNRVARGCSYSCTGGSATYRYSPSFGVFDLMERIDSLGQSDSKYEGIGVRCAGN